MVDRITATIDLDGRTIVVDVLSEYGGVAFVDELTESGELVALACASSDRPTCTMDTMFAYWTDDENLRAERI